MIWSARGDTMVRSGRGRGVAGKVGGRVVGTGVIGTTVAGAVVAGVGVGVAGTEGVTHPAASRARAIIMPGMTLDRCFIKRDFRDNGI
jgi:hypothetical protein